MVRLFFIYLGGCVLQINYTGPFDPVPVPIRNYYGTSRIPVKKAYVDDFATYLTDSVSRKRPMYENKAGDVQVSYESDFLYGAEFGGFYANKNALENLCKKKIIKFRWGILFTYQFSKEARFLFSTSFSSFIEFYQSTRLTEGKFQFIEFFKNFLFKRNECIT